MTLVEGSGEFVCLDCGESFATSDELDDHIADEHPEFDDDDEYEDDEEFEFDDEDEEPVDI